MSNELISLLVLVVIFLIGTTMPVNMGVLGIVAAFVVGTALSVSEDDIFAGFPGDLFIILVGVTYLFGIASSNGTVNWLVHASVRAVGGRVAAIPWVFFLITAVLTASGAVVPGAVAIVVPIAIGFALTYGINPVLMGLMVVNGATAADPPAIGRRPVASASSRTSRWNRPPLRTSSRRLSSLRPPNRKKTTTLSSALNTNDDTNSSIAFSARSSRSTTPLTMLPNTLIGENPPAVAPLTTISPISTGLMP